MVDRFLEQICFSSEFGRQMRFIAGPRQSGKTTLAKNFLDKNHSSDLFFNWDDKTVRQSFLHNQHFFFEIIKKHNIKQPWVCFDEIHKTKNWKNILKAHFDSYEQKLGTIVTGSARLDMFRRSGDSLAGRYFLFRLMPLSLNELSYKLDLKESEFTAIEFIENRLSRDINIPLRQKTLKDLLVFSGFPEPFLNGKIKFQKLWQKNYSERIIFEDIRDISQIRDLDSAHSLLNMLSGTISSPLSINSLREDLELNHSTVKNYLKYFNLSYLTFEISPYSKNLRHSIKKEKKLYFYDWTRVEEESAKFENYIAVELQTLANLWTDSGYAETEIFYLRLKNKKESDFLITKDKQPWLIIEVKLNSKDLESHHYAFSKNLGNIPILQITNLNDLIIKKSDKSFVVSADRFL
jgi:uncharacterized protein